MGMYTELIFGAELKSDTPENILNTLKYMCGDDEITGIDSETVGEDPEKYLGKLEHKLFDTSRWHFMLNGNSAYFPLSSFCKLDLEKYTLRVRSNIKNYESEIEKFIDWIRPYLSDGSGAKDIIAFAIYEENKLPQIFYLNKEAPENEYGYMECKYAWAY